MGAYNFDLSKKNSLDQLRSQYIYQFNLARNIALMSDDPAVVRYFYQIEARQLCNDQWIIMQVEDRFLGQYRPGNAFAYFGICPMIVSAKTRLVAGGGFTYDTGDDSVNEMLEKLSEIADFNKLFTGGAHLESALGDFAYRISYDPESGDKPIVDIVEPQNLEVNYKRGKIVSYIVKEAADDDPRYQLCEIHYLNAEKRLCIMYRFKFDGHYLATNSSEETEAREHFPDVDTTEQILPFNDFVTIVYKQNATESKLYKGERGVPDIQGLDTIEDNLSETLSNLMDAIRKGGVREYIDEDLRVQDLDGNILPNDPFNKTIYYTKGSSTPGSTHNKHRVVQGDIRWEAYKETTQLLMSAAINKAGLSPTTLGLTGLESINSSSDAQDAREKPSMRTRELSHESWRPILAKLVCNYLQVMDYINGNEICDYSGIVKISFPEYNSPTQENITEVLTKQVAAGIKSLPHAIQDLNKEYSREDAEQEALDILAEKLPPMPTGTGGNIPAENMENTTPNNGNSGDSDPLSATAKT